MSRFLLRAILASIFAWLLGGAAAAPAAVTPPSEVVATYTYASHHDSLLRTHSASERGPPASYDNHMPGGAVDRGSHGASARADGTTTAPVIEYDHSGAFVRGTRATGTTQEQAQSFDEALTSRGPVDVAAKAADDIVVPLGWNASTKLPSGGSVRDVGNRIWGTGLPSADRLAGMSDAELRALASLDDARMLNAMYKGAGPAVPGNKTAPIRIQLSQQVIDAWRRK